MLYIQQQYGIKATDQLSELFDGAAEMPVDAAIIVLCTQGQLRIEVNEQAQTLSEQELLLCLPEYIIGHCMQTPDFRCTAVSIPNGAINDVVYTCIRQDKDWFRKLNYLSSHPVIHLTERQQQINRIFSELFALYETGPRGDYRKHVYDIFAQAMVYEVLTWITEQIEREQAEGILSPDSGSSRQDEHFRRFLVMLQQNKGHQREVTYYASQLGITPKYLAAVCKRCSGRSPLQFINEITIREAKQLLMNSGFSIKEVAYELHFSNASMFCKFFRLHTGQSPLQFREKKR